MELETHLFESGFDDWPKELFILVETTTNKIKAKKTDSKVLDSVRT